MKMGIRWSVGVRTSFFVHSPILTLPISTTCKQYESFSNLCLLVSWFFDSGLKSSLKAKWMTSKQKKAWEFFDFNPDFCYTISVLDVSKGTSYRTRPIRFFKASISSKSHSTLERQTSRYSAPTSPNLESTR